MSDFISLRRSLIIQFNVIGALILRETITRYGRKNIGFLWLFVEPLTIILLMTVLWSYVRGASMTNVPIMGFILSGYPLAMMWRNTSSRCVGAIGANTSLLFHRNVRVLDVFMARVILEIMGSTVAFIVLMISFVAAGLVDMPVDFLRMMLAWVLIAWFAFALGLIIGTLSERYEVFGQFWKSVSLVLFPLSGVFYLVDALPRAAQDVVLLFPMVHGTEMLRHGYFGSLIRTHEDPFFIILVNICMTFIGLVLVQKYSKGVEPS